MVTNIAITKLRHGAWVLLATIIACTDVTGPLAESSAPAYDVTTQAVGDVYIVLETDPDGTAGTFSLEHTFGTNSNPVVPSPFTLQDGRLAVFNSVAIGSYTVSVTVPADWDLVATGAGSETACFGDEDSSIDLATGVATIDISGNDFVVCTFVLGKRATLTLDKRENGELPLSQAWAFDLRSGASETAAGAVRAAGTASTTTGEVSFTCASGSNPDCAESAGVLWVKAGDYQLCEVGMTAGSGNNLDGFTPAGSASEGEANGAECVNVTLGPGTAATTLSLFGLQFVDNAAGTGGGGEDPPPSNATPLTISEWRNHESCGATATNRKGPAASSGGSLELYLPNHPDVFPLGLIAEMDCEQATRILWRQDFQGDNRANDAAYTLAAQLLAARLNKAAGAPVPECVAETMSASQDLLGELPQGVAFTGTGEYLGPKSNKGLRAAATTLAEVLTLYNSRDPNVLANDCG
jgi:hypothetical protein